MSGATKLILKGSNCNELLPNADGSINANVKIVDVLPGGDPEELINYYSEVNSVPTATTVDILTVTVPVGKVFLLIRIDVSGCNIGTYRYVEKGVRKGTKRTWFNGDLCETFDFSASPKRGLEFIAGEVFKVQVENFRPNLGNFEARAYGILIG